MPALRSFRVLDPACGSGNFLLLSLLGLKDLEHQVILEAEALGLPRAFPMVGPENVLGIELNPYAAELARVTVWIGEIQWMLVPRVRPVHEPDPQAARHHRAARRGAERRMGLSRSGRRRM